MWTHKPHIKRKDVDQLGQTDTTRGSNNMMYNAGYVNNPHNSRRSNTNNFPHYQNQDSNQINTQNLNLNLSRHNLTHSQNRNPNLNLNLNLSRNIDNRNPNLNLNLTRTIDNTPAWINKKDDSSKKQKLVVTSGSVFNTASTSLLRKLPLSLDKNLPSTVLRFGTSADNEIAFSCHLDSCAAMNIRNSLLHV